MIENWEYFVAFGIFITGIGGASNWLIKYDESYKNKIDDNEAIIRTNFFEEWIDKVKKKHAQGVTDISDNELNSGLTKLFKVADLFEECKHLNDQNRECVKYIQIMLILLGISIVGYPFAISLSQEVTTLYHSGMITAFILFLISLIIKIMRGMELKKRVRDLTVEITISSQNQQMEETQSA